MISRISRIPLAQTSLSLDCLMNTVRWTCGVMGDARSTSECSGLTMQHHIGALALIEPPVPTGAWRSAQAHYASISVAVTAPDLVEALFPNSFSALTMSPRLSV